MNLALNVALADSHECRGKTKFEKEIEFVFRTLGQNLTFFH